MTTNKDPVRAAVDSRYPIIHIHSADEERALGHLGRLARESGAVPVHAWTCTAGFTPPLVRGEDSRDPLVAIQALLADPRPGFYVFQDLAPFLARPELARTLRDAYAVLCGLTATFVFILSPELGIPPTLEQTVRVVRMPPPAIAELAELVRRMAAGYGGLPAAVDETDLAFALTGLELAQARHILHGVLGAARHDGEALRAAVGAAKAEVAGAYLHPVPDLIALDAVGGLSRLKEWIGNRARLFDHQSLAAGLPMPKGILIMGISGCGKSLCAKVVAHTWRLPLFRLDMNLIYAQRHGSPEATFDDALRAIESVAPAVLWIDEIENGLGLGGERHAASDHILSAFLTWMQEKPPLVFVAATANRIEALPAELIRKGRFDQVFFCDLPNEEDRAEIFAIHLRRHQADPGAFDLAQLVAETADWNAAEIEQAVIAARIDAAHAGRAFATPDVLRHCRVMVPLARTMSEQIAFIRDWAWDRATPAAAGRNLEILEPAVAGLPLEDTL